MKEIFKALKKFQNECPKIKKDSTNPFFKSKYADLAGIWETIQPVLAACDLVVIQPINGKEIRTIVLHSSGEMIESVCPIICKSENNPQDFGAACTYAKRQSLTAILSVVADDDDDGNQAAGNNHSTKKPQSPEQVYKDMAITTVGQWLKEDKINVDCIKETIKEETGRNVLLKEITNKEDFDKVLKSLKKKIEGDDK